ncbi:MULTISPECIES: CoxG family protein [unclassified Novosphingobium]|uniref:CoxG family protein n=1 Tax=unclassified Novosphingobium TaxID=2644732 RepID=UPI001358BB33|nr:MULTISPECIES: SRPBCC family protein [unclassified Novosphingobium]
MIETTQTVTIAASLGAAWDYARDVERWAEIMPGYQSCQIADEDNSLWILKVGVGGLVRTVKVAVHVERWDGPERVDFTFRLQGDPVEGAGSYRARPADGGGTEVELAVQVHGSGPMAPMWEAMGAPVLPRFARSFAEELKSRIEALAGTAPTRPDPAPSLLKRFAAWLKQLLGR